MFTIPDVQVPPTHFGQSCDDSTDDQAFVLALAGTGIISGGAITPHTGTDMNVACAAGVDALARVDNTVTAAASVAIGAASASDRQDIVVWTSGTGYQVIAGTPCGTAGWVRASTGDPPVKPAIPANSTLHASVYVRFDCTAITASEINDKRIFLPDPLQPVVSSFQSLATDGVVGIGAAPAITSGTLQPGVYDVEAVVMVENGTANTMIDAWLAFSGSATGLTSGSCKAVTTGTPYQIVLSTKLTVTAAGALSIQTQGGAVGTTKAASLVSGQPHATYLGITNS